MKHCLLLVASSLLLSACLPEPKITPPSKPLAPLIDERGDGWDDENRAAASWQIAHDTCASEGNRLPTVTELWRNRSSSGSGDLANADEASYLWTMNPDYRANYRDIVRISDGSIDAADESANYKFRCIWPDNKSTAFNNNSCFGPADSPCGELGVIWHVDRWQRPAVDAVSAAFECRQHHASLIDMRTFQEIVQSGVFMDAANTWLWTSNYAYWYNAGHGHHTVRNSLSPDVNWFYNNINGSVSLSSEERSFVCIGKKSSTIGHLIDNPASRCQGSDCFTLNQSGKRLIADNQDRPASNHAQAAASCRALGGRLPEVGEYLDLVQSGWQNGSDNWLWLGQPEYVYNGNYRMTLGRWNGIGSAHYRITGNAVTTANTTDSHSFRCIWPEQIENTITHCSSHQQQVWTGAGFECQSAVNGSVSDADSNPSGMPAYIDAWGNSWDSEQRAADSWSAAQQSCTDLGGRLPTLTELYRVRYNQNVVATELGTLNDSDRLWSIVPVSTDSYAHLALHDGSTGFINATSLLPFRCIWPSSRGNVMAGRDCLGNPALTDGGCFIDNQSALRMDSYDRPMTTASAAAWECRFIGGRLANTQEYQLMIHAGLPNGSDTFLHVASPVYWYSGNYGNIMLRFNTEDGDSWSWATTGVAHSTAAIISGNALRNFRCVLDSRL